MSEPSSAIVTRKHVLHNDAASDRKPTKQLRLTDGQEGGLEVLLEQIDRMSHFGILKEHGIHSIETLAKKRSKLHQVPLSKIVTKTLIRFCDWYEDFYSQNPPIVNWMDFFDADALDSGGFTFRRSPEEILSHIIVTLHDEDRDLSNFSDNDIEGMLKYTARKIIKALPDDLKEKCHFDIEEYVMLWIEEIVDVPRSSNGTTPIRPDLYLAFGRTQAGKSMLKVVVCAVCDELGVDLYIITKGVAESKDLLKKITGELKGSGHRRISTRDSLSVVADTGLQIRRLVDKIKKERSEKKIQRLKRKFVVIADECDAYVRTEHGSQIMEQAYCDLMKLGPSLRIEISATLMPSLIYFVLEKKLEIQMLRIGTSGDYFGIEQMKPFERAGRQVFLSAAKEDIKSFISGVAVPTNPCVENRGANCKPLFDPTPFETISDDHDERFENSCSLPNIPYTNDDAMAFYESAASCKGRGVLLLDITNPRVNVNDNIFDKAGAVQNAMKARGRNIIIVVHVASGIYVRRTGHQQGRRIKNATISQVIEQVDKEVMNLQIPIFLFGYSKMRRCISYRSSTRVPTHILLSLGKGHSIENFVQAIGRGTFTGRKSVLEANGHDKVTVLLDQQDFIAAEKYINFFDHFVERLKRGDTPEAALAGVSEKFPDSTNFLRHSSRKIGLRKDFRQRLLDSDIFEELEEEDKELQLVIHQDIINLQREYSKNVRARMILMALHYENSNKIYSCSQIRKMVKTVYECNISESDVLGLLRGIEKDKLVVEQRQRWQVTDWDKVLWICQHCYD